MLHHGKSCWEIKENAVQALTSSELSLLYGLFTLYDSSITGDRLPCLHLSRFMKIVQDAGLFTHMFTIKDAKEIFANAILSKLRSYLDGDGRPALTFRVFCLAIQSIAILKVFLLGTYCSK